MESIHSQLSEIKNTPKSIGEVLNNYNMGFLTLAEFLGQVDALVFLANSIKQDIMVENDINENAVNIMFQL